MPGCASGCRLASCAGSRKQGDILPDETLRRCERLGRHVWPKTRGVLVLPVASPRHYWHLGATCGELLPHLHTAPTWACRMVRWPTAWLAADFLAGSLAAS